MDYKKNLLYFTGEKNYTVGKIGIVILLLALFIIYLNLRSPSEKCGGVEFMFAVGLLTACYGKITVWPVSDEDYDKSVNDYTVNIKTRALEKLGVDESEVNEVAPIILVGYEFDADIQRVKIGTDKIWRSNIYKVVVLFFSRNELHSYSMRFDTLQDKKTEGTDVYFYQDIVSVSTASSTYKVKVGNTNNSEITITLESFRLTTKGGTSLTVNLFNSRYGQESVNAMRALLREKKQG